MPVVRLDDRLRDREPEARAGDRLVLHACGAEEAVEQAISARRGGMPIPVSAISMRTPPSVLGRASSSTRPPAGVNLSAFETRLSTTCPMRPGSPVISRPGSATQSSRMPRAAAAGAHASAHWRTIVAGVELGLRERKSVPECACAESRRSSTRPSRRSAFRSITFSHSRCSLGLAGRLGVVDDELEIAANRRQRRAQLVRHERDELVLDAVELAQPLVLHLRLCEQRLAILLGAACVP